MNKKIFEKRKYYFDKKELELKNFVDAFKSIKSNPFTQESIDFLIPYIDEVINMISIGCYPSTAIKIVPYVNTDTDTIAYFNQRKKIIGFNMALIKSEKEFFNAYVHELVHLAQQTTRGIWTCGGDEEYENRPDEIEAYAFESAFNILYSAEQGLDTDGDIA